MIAPPRAPPPPPPPPPTHTHTPPPAASTYLFRFADDGTVRFHDLNTKLELRKRKRQPRGEGEEDEEEQQALLPEKVRPCCLSIRAAQPELAAACRPAHPVGTVPAGLLGVVVLREQASSLRFWHGQALWLRGSVLLCRLHVAYMFAATGPPCRCCCGCPGRNMRKKRSSGSRMARSSSSSSRTAEWTGERKMRQAAAAAAAVRAMQRRRGRAAAGRQAGMSLGAQQRMPCERRLEAMTTTSEPVCYPVLPTVALCYSPVLCTWEINAAQIESKAKCCAAGLDGYPGRLQAGARRLVRDSCHRPAPGMASRRGLTG